jgi:hypothetical protein
MENQENRQVKFSMVLKIKKNTTVVGELTVGDLVLAEVVEIVRNSTLVFAHEGRQFRLGVELEQISCLNDTIEAELRAFCEDDQDDLPDYLE